MTVFKVCKHCGKVHAVGDDSVDENCMKEVDFCLSCEGEFKRELALGYQTLRKTLSDLSTYSFLFDEDGLMELGRLHDFTFKLEKVFNGVMVRVWDKNESFNINTDDELASMAMMAAREFGWKYKRPESKIDEVQRKIAEAIKKDFKVAGDVVLEWEDGVVMSAYLEGVKA